ncbi:MAG: ThiF family adenylyltransferase [Flavobacteriaceae bacterium]|nr:ThiF family adenylyltransferase [Flavobacteriaceae bacterium]
MEYNTFFKRQITLSEIGESGQGKLQKTRVLIVGCGGLGSPIAVHLALSGIGTIHLIDFDLVDLSNLHRQVFYSLEDVGTSKSKTLAKFIKARAPFTKVTYSIEALDKNNVLENFKSYDIIVDGTDFLPVKYLINDACVILGKPLVYGSLYKFEGYVATFNYLSEKGRYTANLRDAFPEIAADVSSCETVGTMNAIVGTIAMLQVNEVLKIGLGIGELLVNKLLIYNSLRNSNYVMKLNGTYNKEKMLAVFNEEKYFQKPCVVQDSKLLIRREELIMELENNKVVIVSVIKNPKVSYPFKIDTIDPLVSLDPSMLKFDKRKKYVLVCHKGVSSYKATVIIKNQFPEINVRSLIDGIDAF